MYINATYYEPFKTPAGYEYHRFKTEYDESVSCKSNPTVKLVVGHKYLVNVSAHITRDGTRAYLSGDVVADLDN